MTAGRWVCALGALMTKPVESWAMGACRLSRNGDRPEKNSNENIGVRHGLVLIEIFQMIKGIFVQKITIG